MRIVFMGTPDFAAVMLQAMLDDGETVVGVFTQPDKPQGRKMTLTEPPVKRLALAHGIPVYQPVKLRDGQAMQRLRELKPDLIVVAAYGRFLPADMLELPPVGCINVHASLLPKYRGAAPIQWCIVRGETETGVSIMHMAAEMDTGDVILTESIPIGENETAGELHDRLAACGASALREALAQLRGGTAARIPQNHALATLAPILRKEHGRIDWTQPARAVHDHIRGFTPWPGAFWGELRIWRAECRGERAAGQPGQVYDRTGVICGDGSVLRLLEVQPSGGKRMELPVFLNGRSLPE